MKIKLTHLFALSFNSVSKRKGACVSLSCEEGKVGLVGWSIQFTKLV